jgi:hypothetical protein
MSDSIESFESRLCSALRDSQELPSDLSPVLHRAYTRLAARNVLGLILGHIWLALARLLAPCMVRLHRWDLDRHH